MRDMEIRGVGNLLGSEQLGQINTIGFDLYMEMLQEAIAILESIVLFPLGYIDHWNHERIARSPDWHI